MAIRTVGALVVNPRRRRKVKVVANRRRTVKVVANRRRSRRKVKVVANRRRRVRKNALAVRTNRRRRARRNPLAIRTNSRRRRAKRVFVMNPRRRRTRRNALAVRTNRRRRSRRNPYTVLRYNRRRRNPLAIRTNGRRRRMRKNGYTVLRYNRRKRHHVRRNSGRASGILGSLQSMVGKLPIVGGVLKAMVGFIGPAAFGAIGVEPILLLTKFAAPYVPFIPTSLYYPVAGLILAALVRRFAPVSESMKEKLAIGIASGAGAVGYYKWRTGSDLEVAHEAAGLDMAGVYSGWGDGGAYATFPQS